jgi:hypothetical protein
MMEVVLLVEGCGFPPLRQKQSARMGHGALGVGWLESMENYQGLSW